MFPVVPDVVIPAMLPIFIVPLLVNKTWVVPDELLKIEVPKSTIAPLFIVKVSVVLALVVEHVIVPAV
jgi:hypothetical protein